MFDILTALHYIHSMKPQIIHRDIKPENILIDKKNLQIADFGWSNENDNKEVRNTFCGTPDYLAPEMIVGSGHNEKLDMWTVGVLMYELLHGKPPFTPKVKKSNRRTQQREIEKNILKGNIEFEKSILTDCKEVMIALLNGNKELRPGAQEVLEFPFFIKRKQVLTRKSERASDRSISSNVLENENKDLKKKLEEMEAKLREKQYQIQKTELNMKNLEKQNQMMVLKIKETDQRGSGRFNKNGYNSSVGINPDNAARGGFFDESLPKKSPDRANFVKNRGKKLEIEKLKNELKDIKESTALKDKNYASKDVEIKKMDNDLKKSRNLNINFFEKHKSLSTLITNFYKANYKSTKNNSEDQLDFEEMFQKLEQIFEDYKSMKSRGSKSQGSRSNLHDNQSTYTNARQFSKTY